MNLFTRAETLNTGPDTIGPDVLARLAAELKSDGAWTVSYTGTHLEFGEIYLERRRVYVGSGTVNVVGPHELSITVTTSWLHLAGPYFISVCFFLSQLGNFIAEGALAWSKGRAPLLILIVLGPIAYFLVSRAYVTSWMRRRVWGAVATSRVLSTA